MLAADTGKSQALWERQQVVDDTKTRPWRQL
jgi:hypothetical protein